MLNKTKLTDIDIVSKCTIIRSYY